MSLRTPGTHPDQDSLDRVIRDRSAQRPLFVGRQRELERLRSAYETAASGGGGGVLVTLVGEPGIGKTALCEQLASFVVTATGRVLLGHCYEAGSFRPPYQPFVEAFGSYINATDPDALTADLSSAVPDLVRMIPSARERLNATPRPPGDPEEDRWGLLQAGTDLLHYAAARCPVLLILEDLHDADRGTLDMLLYLARNLSGARILVVGTYRDVAVDRAHPLSTALTELHRASNVVRLQLRGLSIDEVQHLLAEASQQHVPQPFAELLHRQTDGNPLFVHETLRYVVDEGLVEARDGALRRVGETSLAGRIPEGLRDAVGKRLSHLAESTNRVLTGASVIGREFEVDVLRKVLACPEDELDAALEEAAAAAIIQERSVAGANITYRFGHAFFQQTLYEEIVAPRRIRLHQQVAHALEATHRHRLDEHAAELAEHYAFSSDALDLAKAVNYGVIAARLAASVFAYGEAARQLERALVVQDLADPTDRATRCDLLLGLGEALWPAGDTARVISRIVPDAFALAESLADRQRTSRACQLALDALTLQGATAAATQPEYMRWAEQARANADPDSIDRVKADMSLALVRMVQGRWHAMLELRMAGLALARRLGKPEVLFSAAFWTMNQSAPRHWDQQLRLIEESVGWPRDGVSGRTLGAFLWMSGCMKLADGDRVRAEELWSEVAELATRTHVATVRLFPPHSAAILAVVDGRLEDALESLRQYVESAEALGALGRGRMFSLLMLFTPLLHLGRAETWLALLDEFSHLAGPAYGRSLSGTVMRAICLAHSGHLEHGATLVAPLLDQVETAPDDDETPLGHLVALLQAAVLFDHRAAAHALLERLRSVAHLSMSDWAFPTSIARQLGDAAALLGDTAAAKMYYAQALESAQQINFRPELALTHLRLADVLFEEPAGSGGSQALEHLDIAISEMRDMNMAPALARALALRDAHAPVDATVSETLTSREREIVRLIAAGLTNREIAEKLVISRGTVEVHVKHVLGKLEFTSRKQVAAWVADGQLVER